MGSTGPVSARLAVSQDRAASPCVGAAVTSGQQEACRQRTPIRPQPEPATRPHVRRAPKQAGFPGAAAGFTQIVTLLYQKR
jgi:hypothetical protein